MVFFVFFLLNKFGDRVLEIQNFKVFFIPPIKSIQIFSFYSSIFKLFSFVSFNVCIMGNLLRLLIPTCLFYTPFMLPHHLFLYIADFSMGYWHKRWNICLLPSTIYCSRELYFCRFSLHRPCILVAWNTWNSISVFCHKIKKITQGRI